MKDQIEAKASDVTLEEIIKTLLKATGTATFQSIWRYVQDQYDNEIIDNLGDQIVAEMNIMLREGIIELYDDGVSFVWRQDS